LETPSKKRRGGKIVNHAREEKQERRISRGGGEGEGVARRGRIWSEFDGKKQKTKDPRKNGGGRGGVADGKWKLYHVASISALCQRKKTKKKKNVGVRKRGRDFLRLQRAKERTVINFSQKHREKVKPTHKEAGLCSWGWGVINSLPEEQS